MFKLLIFIVNLNSLLLKSKRKIIIENILLQKENEVLKRKLGNKRIQFNKTDKLIFSLINKVFNTKINPFFVSPETVLKWQRDLIKKFWTFKHKKRVGRAPISIEIRELIIEMKNNNITWGPYRIEGELLKLGIEINEKTIRNIVTFYRKRGKIKNGKSWSIFLKMQAEYIYAMDFLTVDTLMFKRFYILVIIHHGTRKLIQFGITKFPNKEFLKQQMIDLKEKVDNVFYLIIDNGI